MTTAVATRQAGALAEAAGEAFSASQIDLIRRQIAGEGVTDDELAVFLRLAARYSLDPFAREIWCYRRDKNKPAIIAPSRDGWLKIADRHAAYQGMHSDVVRENDEFAPGAADAKHVYGHPQRGGILGAYAYVYRADRKVPAYFYAPWSDYGARNARNAQGQPQTWSPWFNYPTAMILKVAQEVALKQAFALSGLSSQYEVDDAEDIADAEIVAPPVEPSGGDQAAGGADEPTVEDALFTPPASARTRDEALAVESPE